MSIGKSVCEKCEGKKSLVGVEVWCDKILLLQPQ